MNKKTVMTRAFLLACLALVLVACSSNRELAEVREFVEETLNRPPGPVEPMPEFVYYEPFTYSASNLRSPFDTPMDAASTRQQPSSNVKPDLNRAPEPLEEFSLGNLTMVGTIAKNNVTWALIRDANGSVHRVTYGNHMGRNYGRVVAIRDNELELTEIVPSGLPDSWIERPQTIQMTENSGATP